MLKKIKILCLILLFCFINVKLTKAEVNEEGDSNTAASNEITPGTDETGFGTLLISLNTKEGFSYAVSVKIQNINTLKIFEVQLAKSNNYFERMTLDAGEYVVLDASVAGDLNNKYPLETGIQFGISSLSTITEVNLNFSEKTSEETSSVSSSTTIISSSSVSSSKEINETENSWIIVGIGLVSFFIVLVLIIKFKNK